MLGTRLRKLRITRGLTQRQLAEPKYSHAYVSVIESGRRQPSRQALEHFAARLGVDVEELESGRPRDLPARLELRLQEARVALSAGRLDQAEQGFRAVAKDAKRFRLPRLHAKAEEGLGLRLEREAKPEHALEHYQRAEELLTDEPPTARVDAVDGKARCFEALGDSRYAIFLLESLLDTIEREGLHDPNALARLHAGLVFAYVDSGLYAKAAESAAELERFEARLTDPLRVAQMHMNVARLYLVQGRVEDAERSLARAEDAYRHLGLKEEIGGAHLARGNVLSREGRLAEAREQLELALDIFTEAADAKNLTRALNELARVERLEGRADRACELLERSITLLAESDTPILAWAHRELGLTLTNQDPEMAEKHLRIALEMYARAEQAIEIAVTYRALGDLLNARGESAASCDAYRTGIVALEGRQWSGCS